MPESDTIFNSCFGKNQMIEPLKFDDMFLGKLFMGQSSTRPHIRVD